MQSFILWCGGDIKRLHEPLHFRDIPEKFCFLGRKRHFIKNPGEKFCFLGKKRRFIKNPAKKCEIQPGRKGLSHKNCPLPGVKFILSHCFQLFSISSLIISTYLRALEMSWLMVYTSLCVISSLQPFAALKVFLRLWRSPSSSSSVPTPR